MPAAVVAVLLLFFATLDSPVGSETLSQRVDLNAPGAMERIRRLQPDHHAKIVKIVEGLGDYPFEVIPRWIQADFDAKNAILSPFLLLSFPPKRDLAFTLDNTRYVGRLPIKPIYTAKNSTRSRR